MESIAYLVNREFVIVAVDTNYQLEAEKLTVTMTKAKKVYRLNDHTLISVIGNPYKVTDVMKYVLKLCELGHAGNFEDLLEDLQDVFNSATQSATSIMEELNDMIPKLVNEDGNVDTNELIEKFKDKPAHQAMIKDALVGMKTNFFAFAFLIVLGFDDDNRIVRMAPFASIGNNMFGEEKELPEDAVYLKYNSATMHPLETTTMEQELAMELSPILVEGWNRDQLQMNAVKEKGRELLAQGLRRMTPYKTTPNIVYYELSADTGFVFQEPDVELHEIKYNRGPS